MPLLESWAGRAAHTWPYRWLATEPGELLGAEREERLNETFPVGGFAVRDASDRLEGKRYRSASRTLVDGDEVVDLDLPEPWRELVADLMASSYRETVAGLLGQEVAEALELRLVRHGPGDWLGPHTDRDDKVFSHILYFNEGWRQEWGGCLEILERDDPDAVAARVVPRLGASAMLAQAPDSWHQVTKVRDGEERTRCSLLVHGMRSA